MDKNGLTEGQGGEERDQETNGKENAIIYMHYLLKNDVNKKNDINGLIYKKETDSQT